MGWHVKHRMRQVVLVLDQREQFSRSIGGRQHNRVDALTECSRQLSNLGITVEVRHSWRHSSLCVVVRLGNLLSCDISRPLFRQIRDFSGRTGRLTILAHCSVFGPNQDFLYQHTSLLLGLP